MYIYIFFSMGMEKRACFFALQLYSKEEDNNIKSQYFFLLHSLSLSNFLSNNI